MADQRQKPEKPDADYPEGAGNDIAFGNRTIGWYKWAAWFSKKIYDSRAQSQLSSPQQALAILCKGDELGLPPFASWTWIYQTKAGRLAIQSKGALAVVQSKPAFAGYEERIEQEGTPQMRGVAIATRRGFPPVIKEFTLGDAEAAGLLRERRTREGQAYDSTYHQYLKDMLLARARGRALDIAFAAELGGISIEGVAEDVDAAIEARQQRRLEATNPPKDETPRPRDPLLVQLGRPAAMLGPGEGVGEGVALAGADTQARTSARPAEPRKGDAAGPDPAAGTGGQGATKGHPGRVVGAEPATKLKAKPEPAPRPAGPAPIPKKGSACPRCTRPINEMGGCDYCGWPGEMDFRDKDEREGR